MSQDLFRPGDRISHAVEIEVREKIAEGGMGEVYEAVLHGDQGFEKRVALKVVRADLAGRDARAGAGAHATFLLRLVNEAKLVSNLIHTHIVQIYSFGTLASGESLDGFIAMEYVYGVNLRSFIDRHLFDNRKLPVDIAVYIVSRLARALEYAHTRIDPDGKPLDIVHRDVSPTNVLISLEGVVKLSDFGIAKALVFGEKENKYIAGKQRYMAPEQLSSGNVDFRADIFSTGLLLFELITCTAPERDRPLPRPSQLRPDVPPEVDAIVARATAERPADRYATTEELAVALERAIYEKGYGPTFVTLARYLAEVFPAIGVEVASMGEEKTVVLRTDARDA